MKLQNWINGEAVDAIGGKTLDNINPKDGTTIGTIPASDGRDVEVCVSAADAAWRKWANVTTEKKSAVLERIAQGIEARFEEFVEAEALDTGKPPSLTRIVDIPRAIDNFRFFAAAIRTHSTGSHAMSDAINYTMHKPVGIAGLITPWNLPLYLLTWKVAPALAMGNAMVCKPSELTPTTASLLGEVMRDAGLPNGLYNVVHGLGPDVGAPIVAHPSIKAISFTGGTATGRIVAASAAPLFKKVSLELGGKNATIIFEDADIARAAKGAARAGFLNQGQICLCGSRLLVHNDIRASFTEAFLKEAQAMKAGMGSLISSAHRDKVAGMVQAALADGGTLLCGGQSFGDPNGAFYEPTVIDGLDHSCHTAQTEIFGPVVTIHGFDSDEEAVRLANDTEYGLSGSVWTSDLSRGHRVAQQLDTGMVWVNTWLKRDLRVPFGGMKMSGVGREGGNLSLNFFSEVRNICIRYGGSR
jgi:aminomuconate-semialdehyde/2-hydroxymuconate-6-semialdehyde dehydrogenase